MSDGVVERIKKLLRLSRSANRHEAELALARAFELAQRHHIDVTTLDLDEESERIVHEWFKIGGQLSYLQARAIGIVMTFFNVNACVSRPRVVFVGAAVDVQIAWYVYGFIVQQGRHWLRDYERSERAARRRMTLNKRRSFTQGFVYGISRQLSERQQVVLEDSQTALVLTAQEKARTDYMAELMPSTRTIKPREVKRKNETALVSGFLAGQSAKINKPLNPGGAGQLLLE